MDILPAIDLRDGKVVRLQRGDYDAQTTYSDDPTQIARTFIDAGVEWIHTVDLDAARSGSLHNTQVIQAICDLAKANGVKVQAGGGIRTVQAIERLQEAGVSRMVIGSAALKDWDWFEGLLHDENFDNSSFALGLDARNGYVAAEGWTEQLDLRATDIAARVQGSGLGAIVYTDIARDGMLTGVNLQTTQELIGITNVPIIASGGVSCLEDVRQCRIIGCSGVVIGKAWYEGRVDLSQAVAEAF
jgi:phosphoribosylformimino-5-aminoimidazole carboxamide ribotide isomerase